MGGSSGGGNGNGLFNLDQNTLMLSALAEAAAQTAMPTRTPIPTGAVLGSLAGGLTRGAKDYYGIQKDQLEAERLKAQVPAIQQQTAIRKMLADRLTQRMSARGSGSGPAIPQSSGNFGALAPSSAPQGETSDSGLSVGGMPDRILNNVRSSSYDPLIQKAAQDNGVPYGVLSNLFQTESNFNPNAKSPKGALGIGQFMPGTARRFGIDPFDPDQAIPAAGQYVASNTKMFGGNLGLGIAGYNWGEGNVQKWYNNGADPGKMPEETRNYVKKVTGAPIETWVNDTRNASAAAAPSFGSLAPRGVTATTGSAGLPPGISSPYDMAVDRELAALAGMGDVGKGMWDYYTSSPEYKASVAGLEARARVAPALQEHEGKGRIDLSLLPEQERIKTAAQQQLYAAKKNTDLGMSPQIEAANTAAKIRAELETRYRAAGMDPSSPDAQQMIQADLDKRPEAVRLADASGLTGDARNTTLKGAIPGNAPTGAMKEAPVYQYGTPEQIAALDRANAASRSQTTINNVTNPIAAGIGKGFVEQQQAAMGSANTIRSIHQARQLVDNGIVSGPLADQRMLLARVGEMFGIPPDATANTAAFQSAIGNQVLSMVKELGSGTSISNADRAFAEKMAGGNADLGEKSIRDVLNIREKLARDQIRLYRGRAEKLLGAIPPGSDLQQVAPLIMVDEPPEYVRQTAAPGATTAPATTAPQSGGRKSRLGIPYTVEPN